jgi:type VI secretion system protein ImpK
LVFQFHDFYAEVLAMAKAAEKNGDRHQDEDRAALGWAPTLPDNAPAPAAEGAPYTAPSPPPSTTDGIPPALAAHLAASTPGAKAGLGIGPEQANASLQPSEAMSEDNWPSQVDQMVHRLAQILDLGYDHAARLGGAYGATLYTNAKYAMAALADEVFLHQVQWGGAAAWGEDLLETRMFGSSLAGERLFHDIDAVLKEGSPINIELAAVYLLVLTLGFRGRYRGHDDSALDAYRQRLRSFIGNRLPPVQPDEPIFTSAYHHTLDEGSEQFLPAIARWVWLSIAALLIYLVVSHGIWLWLTGPITTVIQGG